MKKAEDEAAAAAAKKEKKATATKTKNDTSKKNKSSPPKTTPSKPKRKSPEPELEGEIETEDLPDHRDSLRRGTAAWRTSNHFLLFRIVERSPQAVLHDLSWDAAMTRIQFCCVMALMKKRTDSSLSSV